MLVTITFGTAMSFIHKYADNLGVLITQVL